MEMDYDQQIKDDKDNTDFEEFVQSMSDEQRREWLGKPEDVAESMFQDYLRAGKFGSIIR